MPKKTSTKIKILAYGDSPTVPSGFGTVMYNIFYNLGRTGRYDIDIFGINDRGAWKDPEVHPYHVYQALPPGETDPYGRSRFVDILRGGGVDLQPDWDLIFFLNDPFVLENPIPFFNLGTLPAVRDIQKTHYTQLPPESWFKTIGYFPVDSLVKPHWVKGAISMVDYPVTYTDYGKAEIDLTNDQEKKPASLDLKIIPHGNNFAHYYPLEPDLIRQFRQDFFSGLVREETFLVIVVGRNQRRKDIPRAMRIFKEFQKRRPDSFLYVHAEEQELWGSLQEVAYQIGLKQNQDWAYPKDFIATKGFPTHILNALYNAADAHISATQGEGWGLPITEAMATKTINLAPQHTAIPELFNTQDLDDISINTLLKHNIRGIPAAAGTTTSEWICHGSPDLERIRPLVNVDDAVQKLLWIHDHPQEVAAIEDRAYEWMRKLSWKNVVKQWDKLFQEAFNQLEKERQNPDQIIKQWAKMPAVPARRNPQMHTPATLSIQTK
jgi:glycosyltransferase involved in cell wall biosynthesis